MTLSSIESEYFLLSEEAKEVEFIWMLLKSMILEVNMPITVIVNNVGAIFMFENVTKSNMTKHLQTYI